MDKNQAGNEGRFISRGVGGAKPPLLSPPPSEASPGSVQSALRGVRPDDMDAIFDDALFGASTPVGGVSEVASDSEKAGSPVLVGLVEWYMERGERPAGPFRLERLRELWHQGEFSPDTLFWCEAWSHWKPLSRVPELVAALTDAGLPTVTADSVSVASARRKEARAGSEAKAVAALPSLLEEEEAWMERMQEEREQAREEARSALLNAPSAPVLVTGVPAHVVPVPPVPVIPSLVAPEAPAPSSRGKGPWVGAVMGGAVVALVAGALFLFPSVQLAPEQVSASAPVVASAPAVRPVAPVPPPPAPVAPVAEKQEARVVTAEARAEPPRMAPVAGVVTVEKKEAEASGRRQATSRPEEPRVVEEERLARAAGSASRRRSPPPEPLLAKEEGRKALQDDAPAEDPTNFDDSLDKEFERELGFAKDSPKHEPEDPRSKRTVYLPPEPGKELPESLSTAEVMAVVSSHKEGIVSCIQEHAPLAPDSGRGRFVVRWRVQPSGTASEILMETEALKGTPFARCIGDQVRSWKFPRHRVQSREPVRFPFTY